MVAVLDLNRCLPAFFTFGVLSAPEPAVVGNILTVV